MRVAAGDRNDSVVESKLRYSEVSKLLIGLSLEVNHTRCTPNAEKKHAVL